MRIAAVILAAGASSRFGAENKLLAPLAGMPVVAHTVHAAAASRAASVLVVTGSDHAALAHALGGPDFEVLHCPLHADGMGTTIAHGVAALGSAIDGAMILPGDMPLVTARILDGLITAFESAGGKSVVAPLTADGVQRNPVIWPRRCFAQLCALRGPRGAKHLLGPSGQIIEVVVGDAVRLLDIDTQGDLERAATLLGGG